MSKELVISSNRHETRVAILEDDQVFEVYHQRENEYSLAGSIHKGRVTRVLPGMQSAFVDIGLDRDAFLYVSDFFEDNEEYDKIVTSVEDKVLKMDRTPPAAIIAAPPAPVEAAPVADAPEPATAVETGAAPPPELPGTSGTVAETAASEPEQRRDDRDRDRRGGRRSRRRRGQRGGRALPDSKFYSPGHHAAEPFPPAEPRAVEPAKPDGSPVEDLLVLPGESLAKYTDPARVEEEPEPAVAEESAGTEPQPEPVEAEPETPVAAAEVPGVPEVAEAAAAETPVEAKEVAREAPLEIAETPLEAEQVAGELAEEPQSAPVPDSTEAGDDMESAPEGDDFAEGEDAPDGEDVPEGEGTADGQAAAEDQPGGDEEGPEPARTPTSLTATLREQGPRYQHRVSRRMRRRGGRDRNPAPGEAPRPQEARPEQRTVAAPRTSEGRPEKGAVASISDLLRGGQEIIVQIAKEPLGQKGARITSHIALPGRFLVYMPTVDHIGVSRKIPSDEERSRLKRVLQSNRTGIPGGFIVRTAGDGRSEEELRADMHFLYNMWLDMRQKAERKPAPLLIHHDLNVVERVLRDQLTTDFKSIWVDNEEAYESVLRFVERFQPALISRVKLYSRSNPIFDEFGITAEIEKALRPKVWLKSGGHIVINQTEALVAIDVNTGKFVGKSNRLEDTIVKTNTDAIREIVRQIRLRDLGGIIVVDFIDMDERKNRQKVMQALEDAMRADRAPYKILQFNDFGLVAITRKRVKQSLERTLCTPCPYCEGAGYVKSPQTVVGEILGEAQKIAASLEGKDVMLRVSPDVAKLLKSNQNTYLQELEEVLGRTVIVKSDPLLHQEKFDLA
ncbi:MAG: Rne/Rng family ribonuclease [Bryobacteraceae bacterium]|jgi:ribonuclease G